jgi:hypothetical protein
MCPYARAFMGEAVSIDDDTVILMATTCDQMRHAADILTTWHGHLARDAKHEESGRRARFNHGQDTYHKHPACSLKEHRQDAYATNNLFLLNVPATWQTPSSFQLYLDELKRLSRFLLSHGGSAPLNEKLISTMTEYDSRRQNVLGQKYLFSACQYAEMLAAQNSAIIPAQRNSKSIENPSNIPVALIGGPLLRDDLYILDLIEEAGARVALNAMEYGERTFPRKFDRRMINDDPLLELADAYFSTIPDAFRRPNSALYIWLKERLEQEKIKGVIFHHYIWCDIWHAELARFKEWTTLPVLDIHAGDDGASVRGKMRDLIQTFIQMLK